jgi:hypothetical protein
MRKCFIGFNRNSVQLQLFSKIKQIGLTRHTATFDGGRASYTKIRKTRQEYRSAKIHYHSDLMTINIYLLALKFNLNILEEVLSVGRNDFRRRCQQPDRTVNKQVAG